MNCPHCQVEIGGHVQVGTEAYRRVSQGQCPSCGSRMPPGYAVDFLSSSGLLMSEETARREAVLLGNALALSGAIDSDRRVRFHTLFGAIGLFIWIYSILTVKDGEFVLEYGPLLFSLILSIIFWIAPQRLLRWHYFKYVGTRLDVEAAKTNGLILIIFKILSWILFCTGAILWVTALDYISKHYM